MGERKLSNVGLIRFAGLFTWACVAVPAVLTPMLYAEEQSAIPRYLVWWGAHGVFGLTYWALARRLGSPVNTGLAHLLVGLLTLCQAVVSYADGSAVGGILTLVVAGVLPWLFPLRASVAWLIAQALAMTAAIALQPGQPLSKALLISGIFLGFSSFAFITSWVALRENRARDELRKVNSELTATQALLAESTRIAERVRIAQELHDLVGHHLTALTINLEVASHKTEGEALEHIQQAHSVAKLLLGDVREVVGNMRKDRNVDLTEALSSLVEGVPKPKIHLSLPHDLGVEDPQHAHVLLRTVQEIITNAVRHAEADNLWIELAPSEDGIAVRAHDDGKGAMEVTEGTGLKGIGERVRQVGGRLAIDTALGRGFSLTAWIPRGATT